MAARAERADLADKSTTLAIGTRLATKKTSLTELEDEAFHRYAFAESAEDAPSWFKDNEARFVNPTLPVSKEELDRMHAEQKVGGEVDTRTIKKVVEAKFRKQRKALRRLERQKAKAESIAASDLSAKDKMRQLEKLAQGKSKKQKNDKMYVVTRAPGRAVQAQNRATAGRTKMVDARLRKDKRNALQKAKRAKGKKRKR